MMEHVLRRYHSTSDCLLTMFPDCLLMRSAAFVCVPIFADGVINIVIVCITTIFLFVASSVRMNMFAQKDGVVIFANSYRSNKVIDKGSTMGISCLDKLSTNGKTSLHE